MFSEKQIHFFKSHLKGFHVAHAVPDLSRVPHHVFPCVHVHSSDLVGEEPWTHYHHLKVGLICLRVLLL